MACGFGCRMLMLKSDEIDDDDEVFFSARGREGVTIDGDDKTDEKWGVEMQTIVFRGQRPEGQYV